MKFNDQMPELEVDPQTYDVTVNGELITYAGSQSTKSATLPTSTDPTYSEIP